MTNAKHSHGNYVETKGCQKCGSTLRKEWEMRGNVPHSSSEVESSYREEEEKYWTGIYETTFGLYYLDSVWNIKFLAVIDSYKKVFPEPI